MSTTVVVTGMSGAGRTTALKALEDLGFEAVDNLPATLLPDLIRPGDQMTRRLALGIDCRTRAFDPRRLGALLSDRSTDGPGLHLLFLDCDDEVLRRRFSETRRRHPLAPDRTVADGIARERQLMAPLREWADLVIDTSQLAVGDLRRLITGHFGQSEQPDLSLAVVSFGYRNGLPREADLVIDVRFLPNPHYVETLRAKNGLDPEVRAYVQSDSGFATLMDGLEALLTPLLPAYRREGKSYLTIAFGCTGGRHRSVVVAEAAAARLGAAGWPVLVHHRDTPEANPVTAQG